METGPDVLTLLARLREMDPIAFAGPLQNLAGAPAGAPVDDAAPIAVAAPP
jgi:hypothetical protein